MAKKVALRVTYRVRVHNLPEFEDILVNQVVPLARDLGIELGGLYQTVIGHVGEILEIWFFESLADFEKKWPRLMNHPQLKEIFVVTGPMVEDENFTIMEPMN